MSRYSRSITILMSFLALGGFIVALFHSRWLLLAFGVVYLAVFIAWAVMAYSTERRE